MIYKVSAEYKDNSYFACCPICECITIMTGKDEFREVCIHFLQVIKDALGYPEFVFEDGVNEDTYQESTKLPDTGKKFKKITWDFEDFMDKLTTAVNKELTVRKGEK